jgi:YYY domain-containing protein
MLSFVPAVITWLAVLKLLQLSLLPVLRRTLGPCAHGAAWPAAILAFTFASWYCGLARLPIPVALVPFLAAIGYGLYRGWYTRDLVREGLPWDLLILVCFVFMLGIRSANPTITYGERFMEHGFLASVMRTPIVPPPDPWFAGGTLTVYYYLGYWMLGALGIVTGIPSTIVFNLASPTIFAFSAATLLAIGTLLLDRFRWLPLIILLLPNPSFFALAATGATMASVLWDSTRTIPNTITEFPLFTFLWGDIHPHFLGMFVQLLLILLVAIALLRWRALGREGRLVVILLSALCLGTMPPMNTWDVLFYAPLVLAAGALLWYRRRHAVPSWHGIHGIPDAPWAYLVLVPVLAVLVYLPYYPMMESAGVEGAGIVPLPTAPLQFLLVNGFLLALVIIPLLPDVRKRPLLLGAPLTVALAGYPAAACAILPLVYLAARRRFEPAEVCAIFGLILITVCEFLFLKDHMGPVYYRMNTVFKFYFAAWLLLGIAGTVMAGRLIAARVQKEFVPVRLRTPLIAVVAVAFVLAPLVIPTSFWWQSERTLDGLAYLDTYNPDEAAAVQYLRSLQKNPGIIEAVKDDFGYTSRISSFTGIPTILGWPFHEILWRGDRGGWFGIRTGDVKAIYEDPDRTVSLMRKYNISLLYVGPEEERIYQVHQPAPGLTEVFAQGQVRIYQISSP